MELGADRSRDDPRVPQKTPGGRGHGQSAQWLGKAGTGATARPVASAIGTPGARGPPKVLLAERDEEVQALPAETSEKPFAGRVGAVGTNP